MNAALYQLLEEGRLCKQEPDGGRKMTPFWFPPGYTGPLGGTLSDADLGEGRALPLTEVSLRDRGGVAGCAGRSLVDKVFSFSFN